MTTSNGPEMRPVMKWRVKPDGHGESEVTGVLMGYNSEGFLVIRGWWNGVLSNYLTIVNPHWILPGAGAV